MKNRLRNWTFAALVSGASLTFTALGVAQDTAADSHRSGRAAVYKNLPTNSLEDLTPSSTIRQIGLEPARFAPTAIWAALEHGEKVECLDCIPYISKLLYNGNAKTREISAWWLRRRIFGVFGPGQVYQKTIATLTNGSEPPERRAYAAEALGEFLSGAGVKYVATSAVSDPSPLVRKSSVRALERLNSQGPNRELLTALSDKDEEVRLAALQASIRVHVFTGVSNVLALISDPSARVRRRAAENLGAMRAKDSVVGLIALTSPSNEPDAKVRAAAVAALGRIADKASKASVEKALQDPNTFVRDAAKIALRRL